MHSTTVSHGSTSKHTHLPQQQQPPPVDFESDGSDDGEEYDDDDYFEGDEEEEPHYSLHIPTAAKFLLAGGIAGAGRLPRVPYLVIPTDN